jgi:hypothetical protein
MPIALWVEAGFEVVHITVSDRRSHAIGLRASVLASIKTEQSASVRNQTAAQAPRADKMMRSQNRDRFRALAACSNCSGFEFSWQTSISRRAQSWFADSRQNVEKRRKRPIERGNIDYRRGKQGCDYTKPSGSRSRGCPRRSPRPRSGKAGGRRSDTHTHRKRSTFEHQSTSRHPSRTRMPRTSMSERVYRPISAFARPELRSLVELCGLPVLH